MDVAACCRLAELDVSGCTRIGECGDRALRALGTNCAELARLRMVGCNKVTDTGLGALAGGCRAMKEFAASNCGEVTGRALGVLAKSVYTFESLTFVNCANILNDDWLCLESNSKLKTLKIQKCMNLSSKGIRSLSIACPNLTFLDLTGILKNYSGVQNEKMHCG